MGLAPVSASSTGAAQDAAPVQSLKQPTLSSCSTLTRSEEGKKSESGGICGFVSSAWNKFVGFVKWLFCCCGLFGGSETKAPKTKEEFDTLVKKLEEAQDSDDMSVAFEGINDLVSLMHVKVGGAITPEVRREALEKFVNDFDGLAKAINPDDPKAGWKLFLDKPNHPDVVRGIEKETRNQRKMAEFGKIMMEMEKAKRGEEKVDAVCKMLEYTRGNPEVMGVDTLTPEQRQEIDKQLARFRSYSTLSDDEKRDIEGEIDEMLKE